MSNETVYAAKNISNNDNRFTIAPEEYVAAAAQGDIKAVYHSHPVTDPIFSEFDKFNSISHNLKYVLYSLRDNSFSQFDPNLSTFNQYIGRTFEIGSTDCFALVRDFYKQELNIILNNYKRDENWKSNLGDLFDKHFKSEGFYEAKSPNKYDCILIRLKKDSPSAHIALYVGDNLILHQPEKSFSRIEEYSHKYKKLTSHIIRHKSWTSV